MRAAGQLVGRVLLELRAEFRDDPFLQLKEIERVVPPAVVGPLPGVALVLHQPVREFLQRLVQMIRPLRAQIDPGGEDWHHVDLDPRRAFGRGARVLIGLVNCCHNHPFDG